MKVRMWLGLDPGLLSGLRVEGLEARCCVHWFTYWV